VQRVRDSQAGRDTALQFALLVPLDRGGTAASVSGSGGARDRAIVSLQRPAPAGPGWGYRFDSDLRRHDRRAALDWRTAPIDLRVEAVDGTAATAVRVAAEGALVWLDGLHATRRLGEAFALVDTGGVAGLSLLRENQLQGRSSAAGRFLVSELRPYEANRIAYEPRELPPEVEAAGGAQRVLRPYRGGGIRVDLGLRRSAAREWRLRLADGRLAPAGAEVRVDGVLRQRTGHDGLVFLPPPAAGEDWRLRGAFGECRLYPIDAAELRCEDVR
jgi:outer membrane usher protein